VVVVVVPELADGTGVDAAGGWIGAGAGCWRNS